MFRTISALVCFLLLSFGSAFAQPVLHPRAHLPAPGPHTGTTLPTPHLPPITPHYDLRCTLGYSAITHTHTWTVRNSGHNTAPTGLHFHTFIGSLHGEFVLPSPLAPDDTQVFGTPATALDRPPLTNEVCEAYRDTQP